MAICIKECVILTVITVTTESKKSTGAHLPILENIDVYLGQNNNFSNNDNNSIYVLISLNGYKYKTMNSVDH